MVLNSKQVNFIVGVVITIPVGVTASVNSSTSHVQHKVVHMYTNYNHQENYSVSEKRSAKIKS